MDSWLGLGIFLLGAGIGALLNHILVTARKNFRPS